jgi:hypothetical protein
MQGRYILRHISPGPKPESDLLRIRNTPGVKIIDESPLLVEGYHERIEHLRSGLAGWQMTSEEQIPLPDSRHRIKRSIE